MYTYLNMVTKRSRNTVKLSKNCVKLSETCNKKTQDSVYQEFIMTNLFINCFKQIFKFYFCFLGSIL